MFNAPAGPPGPAGAPTAPLSTNLFANPAPKTLQKPSHCLRVPDMLVLLKHNIKELESNCVLKNREVIRHGSHPFRRYGRIMSRCLSLLWKSACKHPSVLEFISMHELRRVVQGWSTKFPHTCTALAELDIVEMFPNIDRLSIAPAILFFFEHHCRTNGLQATNTRFSVHQGGITHLDCIAANVSCPGFLKISFTDILHFVFWDLMFNDTFVTCSSVFAQAVGTAIGGSASAQYASLVVTNKEVTMNRTSLPPIVRYRDNFLVLVL